MINTLLGKVAGFFEKDFLFASFLPALIFLPGVGVTLAAVVGIEAVTETIDSLSPLQKAGFSGSLPLIIVIFAYILNALRRAFAHFWSGTSNFPLYLPWGFLRIKCYLERRRFLRMRARTQHITDWSAVHDYFWTAVDSKWRGDTKLEPSEWTRWVLRWDIGLLHDDLDPEVVKRRLRPIVSAFERYSGDALSSLYGQVKETLLDWEAKAKSRNQTAASALDRTFGTLETVRATRLGNIIESYNQYSYKRYKIEAEIFWPQLCHVIPKEYYALIDESRILLDFSLTMASLGAAYGIAALLAGPWLWFSLSFWALQAGIGVAIAFFFYRLGIGAASQFGEMIRSSFDLFRLDLLAALRRPDPKTFMEEQREWEEVSTVAVYGTAIDFAIRKKGAQ